MKNTLALIATILALSLEVCLGAPPPVLRNMFSTNAPGAPVVGLFQLNTASNETAIAVNTNQFVFTNGNLGLATNMPASRFIAYGKPGANNSAGAGQDSTDPTFIVYGANGGNGSTHGGQSSFSMAMGLYSGSGGDGTNGNAGSAQSIQIVSGNGGNGANSGGNGGYIQNTGGNGGNASTGGGGSAGQYLFQTGNGGSGFTHGGSGGQFDFSSGSGGRGTNGNGGSASNIRFVNPTGFTAAGGPGNLTGGSGAGFVVSGGSGGFGTNIGGAGGSISLGTGSGGGAKTNSGGASGSITLSMGNGGNSTLGIGGNGGNFSVTSGNAGSGVSNGLGGSIYLLPGTGRSNGVISLGVNSSGTTRGVVGFGTDRGWSPLNAFGDIQSTIAQTFDMTPGSTFYQITNFNFGVTNHFLISTNEGTLTNLFAGYYKCAIHANFDMSRNNQHLHGNLYTNGVQVPQIGFETDNVANVISVHGASSSIIYVPANTQFSIRLADFGTTVGIITNVHVGITITSP